MAFSTWSYTGGSVQWDAPWFTFCGMDEPGIPSAQVTLIFFVSNISGLWHHSGELLLQLMGSAKQIIFHPNEGDWHQHCARKYVKHFMCSTLFGPHSHVLRYVMLFYLYSYIQILRFRVLLNFTVSKWQFEFRHRQATRTPSLNHYSFLPYPNCFLLFLIGKG